MITSDLDLELLCSSCQGNGQYRGEYPAEWRRCPNCDGAGFVPTEFGEKILALIKHNLKMMFEDIQE